MEEATRLAAGTALSGPAGGVAACVALSRDGLAADIIGFDMGGTSTDIAVVRGGQPTLAGDKAVAGARIALPSLDIVTLGAGGGSIGKLDRSGLAGGGTGKRGRGSGAGLLRAGRHRGHGYRRQPGAWVSRSGEFPGRAAAPGPGAATAVVAKLAADLGIDTAEAAAGVHRVVNSRMADGVRVATVRRGVDPRGFTLLAFGGAAGLHVTAVAAELGIGRVAVPLAASVLSAWGMLNTDLRVELSRSLGQSGGIDTVGLQAAFAAMEDEGRARLAWFDGEVTLQRSADMRYGEQVFEIPVGLDDVEWASPALAADLAERFHGAHERLYTYALREQDVVLVNARLSVIGRLPQVDRTDVDVSVIAAGPKARRTVYLGGWTEVPVFDFQMLAADQVVAGPAVIESDTTTVLLRAGDRARFDARGWLDVAIDRTAASA